MTKPLRRSGLVLLILVAILGLGKGTYIHAKAVVAQYLLESAWEQARQGRVQPRPWSWADTWPVARIRVPGQDLDQIVLSGASGRVLAFAPGHIAGTALPGEEGTTVFSGHRDTHFQWLQRLQEGDWIELDTAKGEKLRYQVMQRAVYHEDDTGLLQPTGQQLLRLVTCYPFDSLVPGGPLRYVVSAVRIF